MSESPAVETPPLGIRHLFVVTACVATYLAIVRAVWSEAGDQAGVGNVANFTMWSVGSGVAVSGIVLLVARRLRGVKFPVFPGEWLLVVYGVGACLNFGLLLLWDDPNLLRVRCPK